MQDHSEHDSYKFWLDSVYKISVLAPFICSMVVIADLDEVSIFFTNFHLISKVNNLIGWLIWYVNILEITLTLSCSL